MEMEGNIACRNYQKSHKCSFLSVHNIIKVIQVINRRLQVGNLENHYHFQLLVNSTAGYTKTPSYRHIHDRKIGSLAEIGEQSSVTSKLESEDMVQILPQLLKSSVLLLNN